MEIKQRPESGYQAQFSARYAVALGLFGGRGIGATLDDYTDALVQDPARRALMAKITVQSDPVCDALYPYQFPATLRVELVDETIAAAQVTANLGSPLRPLSSAELERKFADNAARVLDPELVRAVVAAVHALPYAVGVGEVVRATVPGDGDGPR